MPKAIVAVAVLVSQDDGVLQVTGARSWQHADSAGTARFDVPRGARHRASLWLERGGTPVVEEWTIPPSADSDEHTIVAR